MEKFVSRKFLENFVYSEKVENHSKKIMFRKGIKKLKK